MQIMDNVFLKRDYWINNTDFYNFPYLRLEKCAGIVNSIARKREMDLLDIGCGPATLAKLLGENIHYFGIDIAIHAPADNLIEMDVLEDEIKFGVRQFDIVVAAGLFEYLGKSQRQKLSEIQKLLRPDGKLVITYTNFSHIHPPQHEPTYNNVMTIQEFRYDLEIFFRIEKSFPSSHNWIRREPGRKWSKKLSMMVSFDIPYISHRLANNYFFVCSLK